MEWSNWLKFYSLVKNLDISGWFGNWFNKIEVKNQVKIEFIINIPLKQESSIGSSEGIQLSPKEKSESIKFTKDQLSLIPNINCVHKLNKFRNNYDFTEDYKWAIYYIQRKPRDDWQYNAAVRIAQSMQDIDFFSAFEEVSKPEEAASLLR